MQEISNASLASLLFSLSRHDIGMIRKKWREDTKTKFYKTRRWKDVLICAICGKNITKSTLTVDHIIPASICLELGLYKLEFDYRNLRSTHRSCNEQRGNNYDDLPESVKLKIEELRNAKDK